MVLLNPAGNFEESSPHFLYFESHFNPHSPNKQTFAVRWGRGVYYGLAVNTLLIKVNCPGFAATVTKGGGGGGGRGGHFFLKH